MTDVEPIELPAPTRATVAAALHAVATDHVAQDFAIPAPTEVVLYTHDVNPALITMLCQQHGVQRQFGPRSVWIEIPLTSKALHGVLIRHLVFQKQPATGSASVASSDAAADPCFPVCSNPAAHAEGAHDL